MNPAEPRCSHRVKSPTFGPKAFQDPRADGLDEDRDENLDHDQENPQAGSFPDESCWDVFLPDDEVPSDEELLADGGWEWDQRDRDFDSDSAN